MFVLYLNSLYAVCTTSGSVEITMNTVCCFVVLKQRKTISKYCAIIPYKIYKRALKYYARFEKWWFGRRITLGPLFPVG